ncbi:MAG: Uma2 family endonuclease [Isosphaeraceae bacterium]
MSIAPSPTPSRPPKAEPLPPLVAGQRLDQPTFHARYEAMPPGTWAELIDGVVFMPSPVGPSHGRSHVAALVWLACYAESTPGVEVLDNTSTVLGPRSEPQPDAQLRILSECGGRTSADEKVVRGAPELVVEVSHSTRYTDLGPKLDDYERAGVLEYVVRALEPDEVVWYVLQEGRLVRVSPDADGLYRSRSFPGLWLDPSALVSRDTRRLREAVDRGVAAPEHAAFVARLAAAKEAAQ